MALSAEDRLLIEQERTHRAAIQAENARLAEEAKALQSLEAQRAKAEAAMALEEERTRREEIAAESKRLQQETTARQKAEAAEVAEVVRRQKAAEAAAKAQASARQKAQAAEAARVKAAKTVVVPISPSAAQVQARRASPFESVLEGGGFWQSVGANLAGTAAVALMVTVIPNPNKWLGALLGGGIGGVATMTSPVGTWISEAGGGAFSSGVTYGILSAMNRSGVQT